MEALEGFLKNTFEVRKLARKTLSLMGCDIPQHEDYSITLSQAKILSDVVAQVLLDVVGNGGDDEGVLDQETVCRHAIGKMLFIGRMSAPLMLFHSSMSASKIVVLRCHHIRALATTIKRLKKEPSELQSIAPNRAEGDSFVVDII